MCLEYLGHVFEDIVDREKYLDMLHRTTYSYALHTQHDRNHPHYTIHALEFLDNMEEGRVTGRLGERTACHQGHQT
jgi:hypothetical protein